MNQMPKCKHYFCIFLINTKTKQLSKNKNGLELFSVKLSDTWTRELSNYEPYNPTRLETVLPEKKSLLVIFT